MEKKSNLRFENPLDVGIFIRFESAVEILSTKAGPLSERLYSAYYDSGVFHLFSDWFNDEFIKNNLKEIESIRNIHNEYLSSFNSSSNSSFQIRKFYIHWKKLVRMAECLFNIYKYLVQLRITKEEK